jgi:hypothetical protein
VDETKIVELGDIVWFKPERLTSGRRDVYIPMAGSARGAGFAIAWQEDPSGLRPGKGKGPGEGWSGAISNHKTDIWYSYITYDDFAQVDEGFVPGGDPDPDRPGLGRPKALVPFSLPVRVSDNDMVNTHTLKVEPSSNCKTPPGGTEPVCFPEVVNGSFVPINPEEIAIQFCDHPDSNSETCCDPDNHEGDPNCEELKGLYGNLTGTKRYAYLARTLDDDGDGFPDYQYYMDRGGTLDLCDLSGANSYMEELPGTSAHQRWLTFANVAKASKLVCVSSDGRLLDGDVSASRPMLQLQPYTKPDGTKSAWALLGYEESKGMGHSLAAESHEDTDNPVDEIIGDKPDDPGQDKPIKQDIGKNTIYTPLTSPSRTWWHRATSSTCRPCAAGCTRHIVTTRRTRPAPAKRASRSRCISTTSSAVMKTIRQPASGCRTTPSSCSSAPRSPGAYASSCSPRARWVPPRPWAR